MLSVLIPTYNYNISALVNALHKQLTASNKPFEILIFEDGSKTINTIDLSNTLVIHNTINVGRVTARQLLAKKAKYDWLLFLDADVLPKSDTFILNYLNAINNTTHAFFGGYSYKKERPENDYLLRWTYGKLKEERPAKERNKKPYKVVISGNFMIKKIIFLDISSKISKTKGYGFDNYFGALLKTNAVNVLHIDNEVYHLGLDKSAIYIHKKEQAALTLLKLYKEDENINSDNDLLNLFIKLKNLNLISGLSKIHQQFKTQMRANLLSEKPSVKILQLYRISFMCYEYKRSK